MKTIFAIILTMVISCSGFCQKKSKEEISVAKIDSLTAESTALKIQVDSLSNEVVKYSGLYNAVKEKVLKRDFDPSKSAFLIDSLRAVRDSTSASLFASSNAAGKADSISTLLKENASLKANLDSLKTAWNNEKSGLDAEEIKKLKAIGGLKQLKELLDEKIITDAEFVALKRKYIDQL